jgi:UMF1 family MFS transporter
MTDRPPTPLDRRLPIFSWAMYDFANTIYSAIVVTAFLPSFLAKLTGRDLYAGLAQTASMVLAGLLVPVAGAIADRTGRAKWYLWWFTIACCVASAGIGLVANDAHYDGKSVLAPAGVVVAVLVLFGLANLTYQASLVFYNSLLPAVASPKRQGLVSGFGVGLGYLGADVAMAIALLLWLRTRVMWMGFVLAGVLFFVSALPLFLFVRPPQPAERVRVTWGLLARQFPELWRTLRSVWRLPPVLLFFVGNFLCVDVVNTLIMWTRRYLEGGPGFSEKLSMIALLAMGASAFPLGLAIGWLTDKVGPKRMMLASQASMLLCIAAAASLTSPWVILPVIVVLGSGGLAGTWTAGRKWLLEIAPQGKVGEFFGLYGITVKLSVFGCTLFAVMADWIGYRVALSSLLAPLAVGIVCLSLARPQRVGSPPSEDAS